MSAGPGSTRGSGSFVDSLVSDLEPVRPIRLARMITLALVVEAAVVLLVAWLLGVRVVEAERLHDPAFVGLLAALALGAGASAAAMTALSIPGRDVPASSRIGLVALPLVLAVVVAVFSPWGGTWKGFFAVLIEGFGCTRTTLLVATPAWIAGLLMMRRLGPLDAASVGLFCASTALLAAALVVQMGCAQCDSWHIALAHYLPVALAASVAALLSPLLLRSPPR